MPPHDPIEVGFQVYATEGGEVFGAVRSYTPHTYTLVIYIENAGDFERSLSRPSSGCTMAKSLWT
jgi:hypothetical protein